MRIGVHGATGRMGRLVLAELCQAEELSLHAAVTHTGSRHVGMDAGVLAGAAPQGILVGTDIGVFASCDVVIDFSHPRGATGFFTAMPDTPLVSGTTGLDEAAQRALSARAIRSPTLHATNFSVGVAVMRQATRWMAACLPDWDAELVEVHHRNKVDAPSGTATTLLEELDAGRESSAMRHHGRHGILGTRARGDVGVHALRLGDVTGQHTLSFGGPGETLSLRHTAEDRRVFAAGAVQAARWVAKQAAGRYDFLDMLGLPALPQRTTP